MMKYEDSYTFTREGGYGVISMSIKPQAKTLICQKNCSGFLVLALKHLGAASVMIHVIPYCATSPTHFRGRMRTM